MKILCKNSCVFENKHFSFFSFSFFKETQVKQDVYFVSGLEKSLLGRPAINALKLLKRVNIVNLSAVWQNKFPDLFRGLGFMKGNYSLALKNEAQPFSVATPRRVPLPLLPEVKLELEKMVDQGVIMYANYRTYRMVCSDGSDIKIFWKSPYLW